MELETRAQFLARVISVLYGRRGLRGRLTSATRGARFLSLGIRLADPLKLDTALALAENLALATNTPAVIAQRREDSPGLVSYQFQLQSGYWQSYTRADLISTPGAIGVGLGEARHQVDFTFDLPHCLVAGASRIAGKTETVKSILCGLFTTYEGRAELGAIICDPDHDYRAFANAAHLVYPIAHEAEAIDTALDFADQEYARRRAANARKATPWVIAIDEAETELKDPRRRDIVEGLGRGAAKFQMFLVIATQKPKAANLGDLLNNLSNRFVGYVTDAPTSARLSGHADLGCHKLTGRGDFMHIGQTIERLQVAMATEADISRIPRAELDPPEVEPADSPRVLNFPEPPAPSGPGRPPTEIEPRKIAHYLLRGPHKISIAQARDTLELARYAHYKHRDFAIELADELRRLYAAMKGESTA